ncbi:hypothetical protein B1813_18985 [Saccharomonospora piscinae]|uniref:Uncharacterized protein n=1 Tax=Saccharomonospora piscinae TaxID=687388 RepID=A0A1V8ZYQ6_SACPI|nr:DUF6093 family protein [Saccharomonospora piscinae]OQO89926.1 hypothetical protein B1813_18985 [Saccharomonospora piscinae]
MSAQEAVLAGRRAAEAVMHDSCVIRPIVGDTTDPTTGVVTPVYGQPVYEGKCKLQQPKGGYPSTPDAGEHQWTLVPLFLHLPVDGSAAVSVDHLVEITSSFDPHNVGRVLRIRSADRKTFATATRFVVEEVAD